MNYFIDLTNHPDNGLPRTGLTLKFIWNIHEDKIEVPLRTYFKKNSTDLDGSIPFRDKTLVVDNEDKINLTNGEVVTKADYEANPSAYPLVEGQYNAMMGLNLGMLKAKGMVINDNTTVAEILLALITENVMDSDIKRQKFD